MAPSEDYDAVISRRSFFAGGVVGTLIGALAGGVISQPAAGEPEKDGPGTPREAPASEHKPAEIEVFRAEHPDPGEDSWQVRVYIGSLRDDDRVFLEPRPHEMFLNPVSIGHQGMYSKAEEGDVVRVYSIDFDGSITMHFHGKVTEMEDVTCEVHTLEDCDDAGV